MKKIYQFTIYLSFILIANAQSYQKKVYFDVLDDAKNKLEKAANVVPTPQQLAWQQLELTAFLHFGINTFTGSEWGTGKESPALFNPSVLNTDQWVKSLQDAGFKLVILTAKHHDGFCLWQTKTTEHCVKNSPWQNGKGDVMHELRKSCDKFGMKLGFYLSPWDRNAKTYGTDDYNDFFMNQLEELLTNYGDIFEVWFDGACGEGPNGKKQEYDFSSYYKLVRKLQPNAVIAVCGDDVRWVGNECGKGRKSEWSVTPLQPPSEPKFRENNADLEIDEMNNDLGSGKLIAKASAVFWWGTEVDVSIRPGWFFHEEENNKVKSLAELKKIYFQSVGNNSVLLLNVPPDKRGLIHENDVAVLKQFGDYLKNQFPKKTIQYSEKIINVSNDIIVQEIKLKKKTKFSIICLQEHIAKGQKVERFIIEVQIDGVWKEIAEGTTIGYKKLVSIVPIETNFIRVKTLQRGIKPELININVF